MTLTETYGLHVDFEVCTSEQTCEYVREMEL